MKPGTRRRDYVAVESDYDDYENGYHGCMCLCAQCVTRANLAVALTPVDEHLTGCKCSLHRGAFTDAWDDETRDPIGDSDWETHWYGVTREPRETT